MTNSTIITCDVLIIGAGAAGLMCAIEAGKRGRSVIILERAEKAGKKILISGGGRCNFTNTGARPENFISGNPHFARSALTRYTPQDFIALVEKHKIPYHEKKLGQLFCDGSSREIVGMLEKELRDVGGSIHTDSNIESFQWINDQFTVITQSAEYRASSLVVACGGASIPKMGATDFGYKVARHFGMKIIQPRPALVPLTFKAREWEMLSELSGVSLDAIVSCNNVQFRENILFTHKGLSGPAILQISSYWNPADTISINLLPDLDLADLLNRETRSKVELKNYLSLHLPKRFAEEWCELYAPSKPLAHYTHRERDEIAHHLHNWTIIPEGTEGFAKAEVTVGGVDTDELSSKTMESKRQKCLYFIGEVVDVTGWLGGYNFQWAWASGVAAGLVV